MYQFFVIYDVDSLFTDFPDRGVNLVRAINN